MIRFLVIVILLVGCAPGRPKKHTNTPSLRGSIHSVEDAKDSLSRASRGNQQIDDELKKLEDELQ